ncbi:MAG: hypothetical protein ACRYFR_03085 [Janthinobacterium lividum]
MPPAPAPGPESGGPPARRTFSDIVRDHPRANGKTGFTVRELCRALRISAASLQELHADTGRLKVKQLRALAALMQEPVLPVLADIMAGVGPRKERRTP